LLVPLDQGEWEGRAMEVMPYLPQGSLADLIKQNGPLSKEQALRLVDQVTEGLEQLHHSAIQHRDLKPTNILVRGREPLDLILADFGSAAMADTTALTQHHGTVFYSAPETLTGMYSRASDYWSLGIILIEALTGDSIAATLRDDALLAYRIVQGKVPIPQTIPKAWHPLLRGLLERDHYRRWQAGEVRLWLDQASQRIGVAAEKKPRPLLIATLVFALALAIGAGLCLDPFITSRIHVFGNVVAGAPGFRQSTEMPAKPSAVWNNGVSAPGIRSDTRSAFSVFLAFVMTTMVALAWILAGICALIGFAHAVNGAPHGAITILLGISLAVGAYILPRLWL
jgi:hypothetical protein